MAKFKVSSINQTCIALHSNERACKVEDGDHSSGSVSKNAWFLADFINFVLGVSTRKNSVQALKNKYEGSDLLGF